MRRSLRSVRCFFPLYLKDLGLPRAPGQAAVTVSGLTRCKIDNYNQLERSSPPLVRRAPDPRPPDRARGALRPRDGSTVIRAPEARHGLRHARPDAAEGLPGVAAAGTACRRHWLAAAPVST